MSAEQLIELIKAIDAMNSINPTDVALKKMDVPALTSVAIGEYVLVRSRNEGVNAGVLEAADETGVVLREARRLHYHKPKDVNTAWYEGVANSGLDEGCRVSAPVTRKFIIEDYSITTCTDDAKKSISAYPIYHG